MFRTILLSLLMMGLLMSLFPLGDWSAGRTLAHWNKRLAHMYAGRDRAHYGHNHSRAWWRRRARLRRARALHQRHPATARPDALALSDNSRPPTSDTYWAGASLLRDPRGSINFVLPARWSAQLAAQQGEMKFHVRAGDGQPAGMAVLTPVAASGASSSDSSQVRNPRLKMLGGVSFQQLRRIVIDRMVAAGGWVLNDMEREIDGRRVYVVLAQAAAGGQRPSQPGPIMSWTFYFTEVNGHIYSLAANAPLELSPALAIESEQVVASLHTANRGTLAGNPLR